MNPAALQILGSPSVEETKKINLLTFQPLIKSGISAALKSCIEKGRASFGEYPYTSKWEKTIYTYLRYVPILDDHNQVTLVHIIMEDITERKRAEKQINLLAHTVKCIGECVSITDMDDTILFVNDAFLTTYGYAEHEILGKNVNILHSPNNPPNLAAAIYNAARDDGWHGELLNRAKDGREFFASLSTSIVRDDKGCAVALVGVASDVSERKQAEQALQKSEEKFRRVIETALEGVWFLDSEFRTTEVNDAVVRMLGYAPEELIGKPFIDLVVDDERSMQAEEFQRRKRGISGQYDRRLRCKDGSEKWFLFSAKVIMDSQEVFIGSFAMITDITERKRVDDAVRESEERFRMVFENIFDGISIYIEDPNPAKRRLVECNNQYAGMAGRTREELLTLGNTLGLQIPLTDTAKDKSSESRTPGSGYVGSFSWIRPDGKDNIIEYTGMPIIWRGKLHSISIDRDITERKRAEEERQRLITAFEQTAEAILVTDPQGIVQYVNPAFERITGHRRSEVIGQNPRILKSGRQNTEFYENLWETISTGGKWSGRFINKKKDGTLFTDETSISPVFNEKGKIINYVGVKRDITSELSLESQLIQAQKLESIGTLASGIAHDFNNILGIIMGHTSLLERLREDSKMYAESVAAIMKASQRGASLVKQLMLFARKTEPVLESVKINDTIREITKLLQETFSKTITISTSLQQDLPAIVADSSQIHQLLLNLLVNARDAMPSSGMLSITTRAVKGETISSRFTNATARQYVKVEVADTGIGMDESTRQRIFEPFFTTKGPGKGTGLGLAVVFGIVEHHHGFIDVRSVLGEGTSFTVYLPIPERAGVEMAAAKKNLEGIPGGTETILLIEDEEVLRTLAKSILVLKGYAVLTAEDGLQGVEMYRSHQKEIAVILSDIGLPALGGHDVFRKIRAINPEAKVIFASGFFDPETKSEMFKAGLKDFIQKPYMQDEVLQKIRKAIDVQ